MSLSAKITAFLVSQKIISNKDRAIYEYGFDLLISDFINFGLILMISFLSKQLSNTIIYLIVFVGLRSVCGGYHAKTHLKCHFCTVGAYITFLALQYILKNNAALLLYGNYIAAIPIILFAPITHANKPLPNQIYRYNRIASVIITLLLIIVAFVSNQHHKKESIALSLSLWIVSSCMIPNIIKEVILGGYCYKKDSL